MNKVLIAILAVIGVCHGDTITMFFTALPSVQQNNNYNNANSTGEATYNGYATATIGGIPMEDVICDDFDHTTYVPSSSNLIYDYSSLTGVEPLEYARFQGIQNYETAAVLLTELGAQVNPSANTVTDYQYALWNLFTPGSAPANLTQQNLESAALSLVQSDSPTATASYSRLAIYTPTAPYASNQEFLGLRTPTPEPATWLLLLVGCALMAAGTRGLRR
jgi:PEP-CTERM motif-containing protein